MLQTLATVALAVWAISCVEGSNDRISEAGNMTVKILGRSGKFTVYGTSKGENDTSKITVEMDALKEVDASGNEVGKTGSTKHSINTFAAQDFTFSPIETVQIGVNNTVTAQKIKFTSNVSTIGTIFVDTYIMTSNGAVGPQNETWSTVVGDVKFNIGLSSWSFCNSTCADGDGKFVDVYIKIKGKNAQAKSVANKKNKFDLGGGVGLQLTSKIMVDGTQVEMATGYPQVSASPGFQLFIFRFPKFTSEALYDPLLQTSDSGSDSNSSSSSSSSGTDDSKQMSLAAAGSGSLYVYLFVAYLSSLVQSA